MDKKVLNNINKQCKEQFNYCERLKRYINEVVLEELNNKTKMKRCKESDAVIILFGQATRIYIAGVDLIHQGYQDIAMILIRSLVEAIINIDYIIQNDQENRASKYFKNGIKNITIKKRAVISKNEQLYKEYKLLCNSIHNNYDVIANNIIENKFNIEASDNKVEFVARFINSCYSYLICIIAKYIGLEKINILELNAPKDVINIIGDFYYFKDRLITAMFKAYAEFKDRV